MDALAQVAGLPDSIKRRILLHVSEAAPGVGTSADAPAPLISLPAHPSVNPGAVSNVASDPSAAPPAAKDGARSPPLRHLPELRAGAAIVDGFLSDTQIQDVRVCAEAALAEKQRAAGMGGSLLGWADTQQRGDRARWLHADEERAAGRHALADLVEQLGALQQQLAAAGYDVGGKATYQLACYPGGGARYVRHADRSESAPSRRMTALCYLNTDWTPECGGQLAVYTHSPDSTQQTDTGHTREGYSAGEPALLVAPIGGRLLLFKSAIYHEVLPAHAPRWAVTAWFHCAAPKPTQPQPTTPAPAQPLRLLSSPQPAESAAAPADTSQRLQSQQEEQAEPQQQQSESSTLPRIFVSIAAYRDSECQYTVRDLLLRARHPDRVRVGICWQVDAVEDTSIVRIAGTAKGQHTEWLSQVREIRIPASEATGPCKARYLATQLWEGEKYYLQIDAHMRFVDGWDELCVDQLTRAESLLSHTHSHALKPTQGAVLTTYPAPYEGEGVAAVAPDNTQPVMLCVTGFDSAGMLRTRGRMLAAGWEAAIAAARPQGAAATKGSATSSADVPVSKAGGGDGGTDAHQGSVAVCDMLGQRRAGDPLPCCGWAAGFSFSRAAALVSDAPYPPPHALPHLFFGEEMYMYTRLWTRGYECFSPAVPICFHQWERSARKHTLAKSLATRTTTIPTQQATPPSQDVSPAPVSHAAAAPEAAQLRECSQRRVLATLGLCAWPNGAQVGAASSSTATDVVHGGDTLPPAWCPGEPCVLGKQRSLQDMQRYFGVDMSTRTVCGEAQHGWLPENAFAS